MTDNRLDTYETRLSAQEPQSRGREELSFAGQSLQDVRALNSKGSGADAFGNLDIHHGDITLASSNDTAPGHFRVPLSTQGTYKPGPGTDCGPITLFPGQNGSLVVDVKPGPQGCTVARPERKSH